jgi:Fe2+ or Zn2+ uptake regulation protein
VPQKDAADFEIIGNHIEFYGICSDCKSKEREGFKGA